MSINFFYSQSKSLYNSKIHLALLASRFPTTHIGSPLELQFSTIEQCKSIEQRTREQFWIDHFNPKLNGRNEIRKRKVKHLEDDVRPDCSHAVKLWSCYESKR